MRQILLTLVLAAAASPSDSERWPVRSEENIHNTFHFAAGGHHRFVLENVSGYVHVKAGAAGNAIELQAHKVIRAAQESDLADARKQISLDIHEQPQMVAIYYDAPWHCRPEKPCHDHHRSFYEVTYDFDISVPPDCEVVASTVNRGDVQVSGTQGHFDISNVNGAISLTGLAGSGDVHTVNGSVKAEFARNPQEACSFRTINGQVDVTFQPGLSADLMLKSFNGSIYSDFDVETHAMRAATETSNGKLVYRSNQFSAARVGQGGAELKFDSLNGNIRLHQAGK